MLLEDAKTFNLFKKGCFWKNQTPSRVLQTTSALVFSNGRAKDLYPRENVKIQTNTGSVWISSGP